MGWLAGGIISASRQDRFTPRLLPPSARSRVTRLFDDQLEVWTLIIQKSTVIPPSLMVLYDLVTNIQHGLIVTGLVMQEGTNQLKKHLLLTFSLIKRLVL